MKTTRLLALLAVAAGACSALYVDPHIPADAARAASRVAAWISADTTDSASPSPTPSGSAESTLAPAPTLGPVHLLFTLPPVPVLPSFTPFPTPMPTPTAAVLMPWGLKDQNWAKDTRGVDSSLDLQAAATYPASADYYRNYSAHWESCLADIKQLEAGAVLQQNVLDECPIWFAMAIGAHQDDTSVHPADKGWNDEWIANYRYLTALWAKLRSA
jgi:hypothetical protein